MGEQPRKKSPRAPSIALDDAIDRALKIYEKERRHAAPTEIVAQHLGYKSANNGAALAVLASLRYYGLVERPQEGQLAVAKDLETYQYAPSDSVRKEILGRWLKSPPVFAELLDKYQDGLPSDPNLRFDLIQRGFTPVAAESVLVVFKRSVEFTNHFEQIPSQVAVIAEETPSKTAPQAISQTATEYVNDGTQPFSPSSTDSRVGDGVDRIPVRLSGGRRAWLEIPSPFFAADKLRLKSQIDLLLTEEDEETSGTGATE
jgi:hypothetical protein